MRFQVAVLLPLAAATFFPQEPQHHARSLDSYDDEIFEILARDLAADEDFYLEVREASHGGLSHAAHGGHASHAGHGHHGHHGHHKGHKGHKKHKKGRKGHHGKKHHHSHNGGAHGAAHGAAGAAAGAMEAASAPSADPSGGQAEQPQARSIEDIEDMLYIRELLDVYGDFDTEGLDM